MPSKAGRNKKNLYLGGICFVTDRHRCPYSCYKMVEYALKAGVRWIQYRDKSITRLGFFEEAQQLRELTRKYGARFIINDHADIAAAVDADGVHLGQSDLPIEEARKLIGKDKIIGISTHTEEEAMRAEHDGADYIGFGPIFKTGTKKSADSPRGVDALCDVRSRVSIPVVAIGGIGIDNLEPLFDSGAQAIAVASAIINGDILKNAKGFVRKVHKLGITQ